MKLIQSPLTSILFTGIITLHGQEPPYMCEWWWLC